jgi:hypothetical protein
MSTSRERTHWYVLLAQVLIIAALAVRSSRLAAAAEEPDPPSRVARLGYVRGSVSFQPAGESEWVGAIANRPLTTGDRLWTDGGDARAELSTGSVTIRLGADTDFGFLNLDDDSVQVQLTQGTITVRLWRLQRDEAVEVDTPNQAFSLLRAGSYRVEVSEDGTYTVVAVRAGEGEVSGGGDTYTVHSGQRLRLTGTDLLEAADLRLGPLDELDAWGQRRDRRSEASPSARYVSRDVVGYEDLDDNGTWSDDPRYGHVWIPTRTAPGWAPYREGHWAWISPWGYTWVDDAPWGYAPFHYGRWVTTHGRWGWVPGPVAARAVYAPALVVFIGGPSFGASLSIGDGGSRAEVGWFPLGPREVYVPGYDVSRAYVERVNVSNTRVSSTTITNVYQTQITNDYRTSNVTYVNRGAPGGVTVVPRQAFTGAQPVARAAVQVNRERIAAAPVGRSAAAAPTRNAVFGTPRIEESRRRPPAAVEGRSVIVKAPPPAPPVPFAVQQRALEARPGRPLARHEVEAIRPPATATARPLVRRAPPGKPATVRADRAAGAAEPAAPAAQPAVQKPAEQAARPPEQKTGERADRPSEAKRPRRQGGEQAAPPKPAEQVARPPAQEPAEQAVKPPEQKLAEQMAKPPARKRGEQMARPPAQKPGERAATSAAAKRPGQQGEEQAAPAVARPPQERGGEQTATPGPAERVRRPPAAAARASPRPERSPAPATGPTQRSKRAPKEKPDGRPPSPDEEPRR